jgi:hypothetical protein
MFETALTFAIKARIDTAHTAVKTVLLPKIGSKLVHL